MIFQEPEENLRKYRIAASTIPNAGRGVFALVDLKKGDFIEVIGAKVKYGSLEDNCTQYAHNYKFFADGREHSLVPMGIGGIVNQAPTVRQQNATLVQTDDGRVLYIFNRDIKSGEEILGHYGSPSRLDCQTPEKPIRTKIKKKFIRPGGGIGRHARLRA